MKSLVRKLGSKIKGDSVIFTKRKMILAVLLLFMTVNSVFAVEEYVSKIYKDIDVIFIEKSDVKLNDLLSENKDDKYYYLIEGYAEKKIRRLIVVNDYEFAMNAIVVVIENNLDNEGAVEMYSTIAEAYETQVEYEKKQEEERQKELARIEGEKEKQRENVDKEYKQAKTVEGVAVYVTGKESLRPTYNCDFSFGLVNLSVLNESSNAYSAINYGISADVNYIYNAEKFSFGTDVYGDLHFLSFGSDEQLPLLTNVDLILKAASKSISKNLFLRAGVSLISTGFPTVKSKCLNVTESMISPAVGIGLEKVSFGPMKFAVSADYLLGSIWTDGYKAAAQGMLDLSIPYAELEKVKLNFHIGVKDIFLMKDTGTENRASVILAIGAENVNR